MPHIIASYRTDFRFNCTLALSNAGELSLTIPTLRTLENSILFFFYNIHFADGNFPELLNYKTQNNAW